MVEMNFQVEGTAQIITKKGETAETLKWTTQFQDIYQRCPFLAILCTKS